MSTPENTFLLQSGRKTFTGHKDQGEALLSISHTLSETVNYRFTHVEMQALSSFLANDPSRTEEALHAKLEVIAAYVKGLRIWGNEASQQIATDILYLIGEK